MQRYGFIQDELERKTLILYVLRRANCAVSYENLTEMALCDEGMDYFEYSTNLANLIDTGHVARIEDEVMTLYKISPKGIQNLAICEKQLPPAVRRYADEAVARVMQAIARARSVTAELTETNGKLAVVCRLQDDAGEILSMRIGVVSRAQGEILAKNFRRRAEGIYNTLLTEMTSYPHKQ